ncbi:hypothetical protein SKP52_24300 (plasmid) [Sphingopyxis fribergensis]|uniref:Uncharacterized protein n=1 Tax=Sphingopyxis fribergensis TaxID=1515612 RepID=A0A0A7PNR0_9SPHN|nr:hypothetical protein SKP52_24300 [Sphingopyxis fribergensis]
MYALRDGRPFAKRYGSTWNMVRGQGTLGSNSLGIPLICLSLPSPLLRVHMDAEILGACLIR